MDTVDAATRSRIMSHIRGKDTKPEISLRKALHGMGIRYRTHQRGIPGRPDVSHRGAKVAVFVDGCFWHGCPKHYRPPRSNQAFWDGKLAYNRDLRRRVLAALKADRWLVMEYWECQVRDDPGRLARAIGRKILQRRTKK